MNNKGLMAGIIIGIAGLLFMFKKGSSAIAEAPVDSVLVRLKNVPSDATMWSLRLTDSNVTKLLDSDSGYERMDIDNDIIIAVPQGTEFPLRVEHLQITKWNEDNTALIVINEFQSLHPTLYDFDLGDYGTVPDVTYRNAFIEDYGSYYFDFSKGQFTK
jgi:hypothetical protein